MQRSTSDIAGWISAALLIALFAIANLLPLKFLWGFNFYSYLPPVWMWIALGVTLVSALPPVAGLVMKFLERTSGKLSANKRNQIVTCAVVLCVCTALFWFFSVRLPLLGDAGLRAREITDGRWWKPTELGDLALHALTYNWIFKPAGQSPLDAYRVISVLSGIGYLIGLFKLTTYVARERSALWTSALLSVGCVVLFFGYIESYSIIAALFPWLFLTGLRAADKSGRLLPFAILTIAGALLHSLVVILFGPALMLLVAIRSTKVEVWLTSRRSWFPLFALVCALLIITGKMLNVPALQKYILPLSPGSGKPIGIFSLIWLGNLINWFLVSGLVAFAGVILFSRGESAPDRMGRSLFITAISAPCLLFVLLWNPQLGGPLDWDLFGLPISALAIAVVVMIETRNLAAVPRWIIPVIVLGTMNLAGFVAVNADVKRSADRFADVITMTGERNLYLQWASLVQHAEHNPELYADRNGYLNKCWWSPPYTKIDSIWTLVKMAETYTAAGDSVSAERAVALLGGIDTLDINIYLAKVGYLDRFGTPDQRLSIAQELATLFPDNSVALGTAGVIYIKLGRRDLCGPLLERAYSQDSSNYLTVLNYGVFLASGHSNAEAVPVLRRALELNAGGFLAPYYLATCYLALGDVENAKTASLRAEANALRPEEQERVKQLKGRL